MRTRRGGGRAQRKDEEARASYLSLQPRPFFDFSEFLSSSRFGCNINFRFSFSFELWGWFWARKTAPSCERRVTSRCPRYACVTGHRGRSCGVWRGEGRRGCARPGTAGVEATRRRRPSERRRDANGRVRPSVSPRRLVVPSRRLLVPSPPLSSRSSHVSLRSWFHAALVRYGRTVSQAAGKQVSSQVSSGARGRRTASVHTFSSQFHHRRRRRRRCRRRCCCCCCCCSHSRGKPSSHRATA